LGSSSALMPPGGTATSVADARGLLYHPGISNRSYPGRQVRLASTTRVSPLAARGGTYGRKWRTDDAWDMYPVFCNMPQICDLGPIILLPFRTKACWGFLSPFKIPTASAGFEPLNLGIRGQHATSAPPKPLAQHFNHYATPGPAVGEVLFILRLLCMCRWHSDSRSYSQNMHSSFLLEQFRINWKSELSHALSSPPIPLDWVRHSWMMQIS
jgi:hypothetical protein